MNSWNTCVQWMVFFKCFHSIHPQVSGKVIANSFFGKWRQQLYFSLEWNWKVQGAATSKRQPVKSLKNQLKNFAGGIQTTERTPSVWFTCSILIYVKHCVFIVRISLFSRRKFTSRRGLIVRQKVRPHTWYDLFLNCFERWKLCKVTQ